MDGRNVLSRILLIGAFLCAFTVPAGAEEHYTFDKEHTTIQFSVDKFGFMEMAGGFTEFDGDFFFCTAHPEKNAISMTLYSKGIHTANGERDEELQGPDFFNAARFPSIYFESSGVKLIDENDAEVTGDLTLLGTTRPITFHVHFLKNDSDNDAAANDNDDDNDDDDYVVNFSATGIIDRTDFGMDYLSPFIIGDDVRLTIEARGIKDEKPKPHKTVRQKR